MSRVITVLGATGGIGRQLVGDLLERGHVVRALGRTEAGLAELVSAGAVPFVGSVDEAEFLHRAFDGAEAAFLLAPMKLDGSWRDFQSRVADRYVEALTGSSVTHVVNLSGVGAHVEGPTGPILGLRRIEQRVDSIADLNVLHLRAGSFMENMMMSIPMILGNGFTGSAMAADLPVAMLCVADIAARAAEALDDLKFSGVDRLELLGRRDYTQAEVAALLGGAIGRPGLEYVQFPYQDALAGLVAAGLAEDAAALLVELHRAYNEGLIDPETERDATTATPTSLESWAESTFAPAFAAAEAGLGS